jgi:large subunit ribosomal protein L15
MDSIVQLNNLFDLPGARKKGKRVGRGIGSGKGKTCGKGHKGQKARSGVSIKWFEGGQMPLHKRVAKRGFSNKTYETKVQEVTVENLLVALENAENKPEIINADFLYELNLVKTTSIPVKLIGSLEVELKETYKFDVNTSKALKAKLIELGSTFIEK